MNFLLADNFIYIVINGHRTNILLLCSLQDCKQSLASCQCTYFHFLILVERTLRVKFISGVFEHPSSDQSLLDIVGCKVTCARVCGCRGTRVEGPTALGGAVRAKAGAAKARPSSPPDAVTYSGTWTSAPTSGGFTGRRRQRPGLCRRWTHGNTAESSPLSTYESISVASYVISHPSIMNLLVPKF